jgi:energy-coupling factor transporter ATP-binding protein EcfA2
MKLSRLQVTNYRCIEDSTEFSVCPVTCLVGKNGAGKTSLLEALYKLNPDVEELGKFDVLMEYPRARRREYQKRAEAKPDTALTTTWELDDDDVSKLESDLGAGAVKSRSVVIKKGYYRGRSWSAAIGGYGGTVDKPAATVGLAGGSIGAPKQDNAFFERHLAGLLPKLLYFSEWHIMSGRISIDGLLQRKQKGELTGPDRVFMALLQLGGTSVEALTSIDRSEELIADLEDAARPVTEEIARYWSQERDLRVSFHLYPGRPGDPAPLDRGLVFETRIVNTKSNLSLNFEERSTGFVWFFSFLVWYSDVRKRYGENLLILLDDPGLGLHAKAQWDLLRYINEALVPHYQVVYATHSPFMIDPEKLTWVRTVEEIVEEATEGRLEYGGTKVGDEVLSTDRDTLLPLQASLGYRIMQDLAGDKRLLLVEKPSDVFYLDWFSARLNEQGRPGLHRAWSVVPCGDLMRLAALAGLLANEARGYAALLTLSKEHPDVAGRPELSRMLEKCHAFPLRRYAEPAESTIEDLVGADVYFALIDLAYKLRRKRRLASNVDRNASVPVLQTAYDVFATNGQGAVSFDPMAPAEYLFKGPARKLKRLPGLNEALARFEKLFVAVNACL